FPDGEVDARMAGLKKRLDHLWVVKSQAELEARHSRLGHHEFRRAELEDVSNVDVVFDHSLGGEVFAEDAGLELTIEPDLPAGIVFHRVSVDRLVRSAMNRQVGLS